MVPQSLPGDSLNSPSRSFPRETEGASSDSLEHASLASIDYEVNIRNVSHELAERLCALRDKWVTDDPYSENNRWGALYGKIDVEELYRRLAKNKNAHFATATTREDELVGFVWYSKAAQPGGRAEVILIVVDPEYRRMAPGAKSSDIADKLLGLICEEVKNGGAGSIFADIAKSPVPNEASIRFHLARGFKYCGEGEPITREFPNIGQTTIQFGRYERRLNEC